MLSVPYEKTRTVTLCHTEKCCPTLRFEPDGVVLEDDFGGKVRLTPEQWADLVSRIERGELPR
ncbi:MAG: hypothetical protein ACRDJF_06715 [Actinomycetota bacterium]